MSDKQTPPSRRSSAAPTSHALAIIRLPAVMARTGLARSTIYHMLGRDLFPRPISLGERAVGWLASEVDGWLLTRIETSRGNAHRPTDA